MTQPLEPKIRTNGGRLFGILEAISVQEIIDRANVGRATFYSHYDNKEDLLASGFDGLLTALRERQREARSHGGPIEERLFAFSHHLLAHADENRDVFPAMVSRRGGALIQHLLRNLLLKVVREDVREAAHSAARPVPEEPIVQFIAGRLFGLMMWWLGGKSRLSVEELESLFRKLAIPALKAAATR